MAGNWASSADIFTTISYWRDVESLQLFAFGPAHRSGWNWWDETHEEHPHLGIFHESYIVNGGQWSDDYVDFATFDLGKLFSYKIDLESFRRSKLKLLHRAGHC